jgi:hypothetical protein
MNNNLCIFEEKKMKMIITVVKLLLDSKVQIQCNTVVSGQSGLFIVTTVLH